MYSFETEIDAQACNVLYLRGSKSDTYISIFSACAMTYVFKIEFAASLFRCVPMLVPAHLVKRLRTVEAEYEQQAVTGPGGTNQSSSLAQLITLGEQAILTQLITTQLG